MRSKATSVKQYLAELPADRRAAISAVRDVIRANLDPRVEEGMQYGMIGFYIPHRVFPAGYHCDPKQPLPYACLASQKNYMSVYLMTIYNEGTEESWFRERWARTGKKLDMGKSCIRFRKLDDLALDVIGEAIQRVPIDHYLAYYVSVTGHGAECVAFSRPAGKATTTGVPARKPAAPKKKAVTAKLKSASPKKPAAKSKGAGGKSGAARKPSKSAKRPARKVARIRSA